MYHELIQEIVLNKREIMALIARILFPIFCKYPSTDGFIERITAVEKIRMPRIHMVEQRPSSLVTVWSYVRSLALCALPKHF